MASSQVEGLQDWSGKNYNYEGKTTSERSTPAGGVPVWPNPLEKILDTDWIPFHSLEDFLDTVVIG